MIPFSDYVANGQTIYLAVHVKYVDRLAAIAATLRRSLEGLSDFRLLFTVFSDSLELVYLCDQATVDFLADWITGVLQVWHDGALLDPVIGMVLVDHAAVRQREQPTLFVVSDGDVVSHWHDLTLAQVMRIVWLHEATTTEALFTPVGVRREIALDEVDQTTDQQPEQ